MRHQFQFPFFLFLMFLCLLQAPFLIGQETDSAPRMPLESVPNEPNPLLIPLPPELEQIPESELGSELGEDHFMSDFIKMLSTLGLLIGLLLFVSWYLKRMVNSRVIKQNDSSTIKVLEQRQLSARATIHIVEIEGKNLVIGESQGNICLLTELPSTYNSERD
ncbi:MAG: flagellar biosynthetic protein FliO [Parachlamydiaceae bacterium]|nr:flagellar biosynthetic protein FliO [Parachlamydiaceae bacterium]